MGKQWRYFGDECPECGGKADVYTDATDGFYDHGDDVMCVDCGLEGVIDTDNYNDNGDPIAKIKWLDDED